MNNVSTTILILVGDVGWGPPPLALINANTAKVAKQSLPLSCHSPQVRYHSHNFFYLR